MAADDGRIECGACEEPATRQLWRKKADNEVVSMKVCESHYELATEYKPLKDSPINESAKTRWVKSATKDEGVKVGKEILTEEPGVQIYGRRLLGDRELYRDGHNLGWPEKGGRGL